MAACCAASTWTARPKRAPPASARASRRHGRPFDAKAAQWIRHAYHIPAPAPYHDGEISVAEAARRLGCSTGVIYSWIQAGQLDARRGPGNRLCIPWNDRIQAACRDRIAASGHLNPAARRTRPRRHGCATHM